MKKDSDNDKELLTRLRNEAEESSGYYDSELASIQSDSLKAYFCQPYGDEVDGRSKFVTSEVADKVNWLMSPLMRIFARNDELVTIKPTKPSDTAMAEDAAKYLDHVLFADNDFKSKLMTFAKDGLLGKVGVCETSWVEDRPLPPKEIKNIPPETMMEYLEDKDYEITEVEMLVGDENIVKEFTIDDVVALTEAGQEVLFNCKSQKVGKTGRVVITPLKPENFLINKLATSIEDAHYVASRETIYKSELAKEYPKLKDEIMAAATDYEFNDISTDERLQTRFDDEATYQTEGDNDGNVATLHKEFIRYDYDDDGYVELLHVKRLGDVILETMPVEESTFSAWCPIPVPHKFYGQSIADITQPMQLVRTVLMRSGLDNVIASSRPQLAVDVDSLSDEGFDQLYTQEIGSPILFEGEPKITPIVIPDMSGSVMGQLELTDRMLDARTGVKSDAMGVDSTSVHNTASGQEQLTNASDVRKEDIADQLGIGIRDIAAKAFKLLCNNQEYTRELQIGGKWVNFDPRKWSDEMTVNINAGKSAGNKQTQISGLMNILQIQQTAMMEGGKDNPYVKPHHISNTLAELTKASGYANSEMFFAAPPSKDEIEARAQQEKEQQANADPRTPEQIEAEGKVQVAMQESQAKTQQTAEKAQADYQIKSQASQADTMRKDQVAAADIERADVQLTAELTLQEQTKNAEFAMLQGQKVAEFKLNAEVKTEELKLNKEVKQEELNQKVNIEDVHIGGSAAV